MNSVGALFEQEPDQWGLRGDPYLWLEFKELFARTPLPRDKTDLEMLLEEAFRTATNHALSFADQISVERFASSGMSSGYVSGKFWRETGFPLILERFAVTLD